MKRRKFLLGSAATLGSAGFLTGTGAFSSAQAGRDVRVEIVGDENAFLYLSEEEIERDGVLFGANLPRVAPEEFDIRNQTGSKVDIDVKLDGELRFTDAEIGENSGNNTQLELTGDQLTVENLDPGQEIADAEIDLAETFDGDTGEGTLMFDVDGAGLSIQAERMLELEPALTVQSVIFREAGGVDGEVEINVDGRESFEIVYWVVSNRESREENDSESSGVPPGKVKNVETFTDPNFGRDGENKLRGARDGGPGYIGVYFPAIDTSFHHPEFDPDTNVIRGWRGGNGVEFDGRLFE